LKCEQSGVNVAVVARHVSTPPLLHELMVLDPDPDPGSLLPEV